MKRGWIRAAAFQVHLYAGLIVVLVLIAVSLTGSALVFRAELEAYLRPDLYVVEPGGRKAELEAMREAVERRFPEDTIRYVELPARSRRPATVWTAGTRKVLVDPYSARILGAIDSTETWTGWIFDLHAQLLSGPVGRWVVGISGLLLVLLALTGLLVWWPPRENPGAAVGVALEETWLRVHEDLHRAVGFWTGVFLLLSGLTGSGLVFYSATGDLPDQIAGTGTPERPVPRVRPSEHGERIVTLDAALEVARTMWPRGRVSGLYVPQRPVDPLTVRVRTAGELHPNGRSYLHLDPYRGDVAGIRDAGRAALSRRILHVLYPLHVGSFGGWPVRALYGLLGLAPVLLTVTGTLTWILRVRPRGPRDAPDETDVRP